MNLVEVVDEISGVLDTIPELNTFAFFPDTIQPPAAVVTPITITFDETYGRGMDRIELEIITLVSRVVDRVSWTDLNDYVAGSGPRSVKEVSEAGEYGSFDSIRVVGIQDQFGMITVGGIEYLGAIFTVDIVGRGA